MPETVLKKEEQIARELRVLYKKYGYAPYKMNKFEAYDLYASNKDFLVGDGVITFTDTDGKLLALKPDVTLSIIKNTGDGSKNKVYYHENVYRISGETRQFKELMQVGLEHIGDTGVYTLYETVYLAAASLHTISKDFVLDVSHLGILSAVLEEAGGTEEFNRQIMRLLSEKNEHEARALCTRSNVNGEKLLKILKTYGDMRTVLFAIQPLCESERAKTAYEELSAVCSLLEKTEYADKIRLDFSVVHDMQYYNGLVFKGFVEGVCEGVLSGGQYDRLMRRMGRKEGAIGFAVYLDLLEGFQTDRAAYDVDALVLYDENTDLQTLTKTVNEFVKKGESVSAQMQKQSVRYQTLVDLTGGKNA